MGPPPPEPCECAAGQAPETRGAEEGGAEAGDARLRELTRACDALLAEVAALEAGLPGRSRLRNLVLAERAFLGRCSAAEEAATSNLPHLRAVARVARGPGVAAVLRNISARDHARICVDVASVDVRGRPAWFKCIARAAGALADDGLEETALSWLALARRLPEGGRVPAVCFRFFAGVPSGLGRRLADLGVDVAEGAQPPAEDGAAGPEAEENVNLDTTTMVALVSNLTHGHVGWAFADPALEGQAGEEAARPVLPQLVRLLAGKRLFAARSALATFEKIVGTIGGPQEVERARRLRSAISPLEAGPLAGLGSSRKLDARTLDVLGAGAAHGMVTTTANAKVIRALASQAAGVRVAGHVPRALTEQKQASRAAAGGRRHPLGAEELQALFGEILGGPARAAPEGARSEERPAGAAPGSDGGDAGGEGAAGRCASSERSASPCPRVGRRVLAPPRAAPRAGEAPGWAQRRVGLTRALEAVHDRCAAGAELAATAHRCLEALGAACSGALSGPEFRMAPFDWSPEVVLELFGSCEQGTALRSSDVDVRMSFTQFHVTDKERQLRYLRAVAASPGDRFEVVRLIEARLPVLRLRFLEGGGTDVDLTMGDSMEGGAEVDRFVCSLLGAAADDGARRFARLVKAFAKAHGLVDAYGGFLNSVCWVFLAMCFLQLEGCLPPAPPDRAPPAGGAPRRGRLWTVQLSPLLLARFFALVERCGSEPHRVWLGWWTDGSCPLQRRFYATEGAAPLVVKSPADGAWNLASALREHGWRETVRRCAEARARLEAAMPPGEAALGEAEEAEAQERLLAWLFGEPGGGDLPAEEPPAAKRQRTC